MPRLREEFDSDMIARYRPAEYRSDTDRYELPCSVCGKILFVDENTKRDIERASERDLDYTFMCSDCDQEYDGLAYE